MLAQSGGCKVAIEPAPFLEKLTVPVAVDGRAGSMAPEGLNLEELVGRQDRCDKERRNKKHKKIYFAAKCAMH